MVNDCDDSKKELSRRAFIRNAATVAASAAAVSAVTAKTAKADVYKSILPSSVLGANEKIRTGHIGTGGMGRSNLGFALQRDDLQPIAICDLYPKNLDRGAAMVAGKFPADSFSKHHDFREIIDNKDVDAVVIATPDHWHCLCTLFAAEAKKAIYCEKPLSTTIEEGRAMIEAVRRNKVVFQGGTMQRSGTHFQEAVNLVQSGYLGKVAWVEAFNHEDKPIAGIGMGDNDLSKYPGCDWDFHQGWVEHQPFNTNRWIYNFRWFLDYSGGKITDWGAHLIDIGLWGMGQEKQPKTIVATGGKYVLEDNRTTPDTLEVIWEYENFILTFSNRVWNAYLPKGYSDHGILFHGTQGTLRVDRGGYEVYPVQNNGKGCEAKKAEGSQLNEPHWQNFADCVRSGKDPVVTVETLHNTTRTCHQGTCAFVAGGKVAWDDKNEKFLGDDEVAKKANAWAYRPYQNGWSLKAPFKKA